MTCRVQTGPRETDEGPLIECACGCKQVLPQFDGKNRERRYVAGHQFAVWWKRGPAIRSPRRP